MIHAYNKAYLEKAQTALARMLDYAVYDIRFDLSDFFDLFCSSGLADDFGHGDVGLLVGRSGVELAWEVLARTGKEQHEIPALFRPERTAEYWTGWALAYYQWATALRFAKIVRAVPIKTIKSLYSPYHEMDIRHFVAEMNRLYLANKPCTNLKERRLAAKLTQRQLAEQSGVPLRTLQQYEQGQKNINKAQAEYVIALARATYCQPSDLLELDISDTPA